MPRWLQLLLPFGLVRAWQLRDNLVDLGLSRDRAWQLARQPRVPAELKQCNLNLLPAGALTRVDAVVDVGANRGEWTALALKFCNPMTVLTVEPDPKLAGDLRERFASEPRVRVLETAVGQARGQATFHRMRNSVNNSFLNPAPEMAARLPNDLAIQDSIEVRVSTIDELTAATPHISVLKIDVEGFERQALLGAEQTLAKTDFLLLEVRFEPFYEGQSDFFEINQLLNARGFHLSNYSPPQGGSKRALFADALYIHKDLG
ncbi:MAG TPA: FkbM family methyltransferase [Pirellulales bacterium]|nr:FkbM family methyltransferase [Pirellulales bacterium]